MLLHHMAAWQVHVSSDSLEIFEEHEIQDFISKLLPVSGVNNKHRISIIFTVAECRLSCHFEYIINQLSIEDYLSFHTFHILYIV
jgi:hypothetical protein